MFHQPIVPTLRNRSAFAITETELNVIAALAIPFGLRYGTVFPVPGSFAILAAKW
jgi:hypothetical protein